MPQSDASYEMIGRIIAAYAGREDVTADDIAALLTRLTGMVEAEGAARDTQASTSAMPALPVDKAITQDKVFCLCCGKGFKMLKRHLGAEHGLSEAEYRTMFNLPEDLPLVAPSYSKKKANYAKKAGFGKYDRAGRSAADAGEKID